MSSCQYGINIFFQFYSRLTFDLYTLIADYVSSFQFYSRLTGTFGVDVVVEESVAFQFYSRLTNFSSPVPDRRRELFQFYSRLTHTFSPIPLILLY
ncbi:hypothetical protein J5U23_01727 [Saccharolobus shibatae B12]|uniref:Uncharacterized protein n=1 Tax=Saccharolobus shibatae (strain ATCC 51178 / DSM 5389 / JCM 8931 / NBRC 15437 / B12) TaxID=523848 RepID=A0A8F5GTE4_SACSH|nr:hypothetical protein J5U23_01727 [Saccharolobus shibatae B12]